MLKVEYENLIAIHPCEIVKDYIKNNKIKKKEMAISMGITPKELKDILKGFRDIDENLAKKLYNATGVSCDTWLRYQERYNNIRQEIRKQKFLNRQVKLLNARI